MKDIVRNIAFEVFQALGPVSVIVILMLIFLNLSGEVLLRFVAGVLFVVAGLILFFIGVRLGPLEVGEYVGAWLPATGKLWVVILVAFLFGFAVTAADPDVQVLAMQVYRASKGTINKGAVVVGVSLGLGQSVIVAVLRVILGVPA